MPHSARGSVSHGPWQNQKVLRFLWVASSLLALPGCLELPAVDVDPITSNVFVSHVPIENVTAVDLLFVIDNSTSMADKQELLKRAVPQMVERLVSPDCIERDDAGTVIRRVPRSSSPNVTAECPADTVPEFVPVKDMHIGVITTSLGSHGQPGLCDTIGTQVEPKTGLLVGKDKNDHAHLIPLVRLPDGPVGPNGEPLRYTGLSPDKPFLSWKGQGEVSVLGTEFANHVAATGETGCGFEAQLESFYRFLIDPRPHNSISITSGKSIPSTASDPATVDQAVLDQRASFLRPKSLVAVVLLTDENDCSILDGGSYYPNAKYGHLAIPSRDNAGVDLRMSKPTDVCRDNPNDACCDVCGRDTPQPGCEAIFTASCGNPDAAPPALSAEADSSHVRCFDQQRRFGVDLLYPVERYIDGLTQKTIVDSVTGEEVPNPLFVSPSGTVRRNDLVYFAGIVGVPWQDIATPETLKNPNELSYLRADQLGKTIEGKNFTRWEAILGKPGHSKTSRFCRNNPTDASCGQVPVPPLDPFMVESVSARTAGTPNPLVPEEKITAPGQWNNINGSEQHNVENLQTDNHEDDLQYACIFPLSDYGAEKDVETCKRPGEPCDCNEKGLTKERPLCRKTPTSSPEGAQYWGKAYPGLRVLQVLHGVRPANAIVASICPKVSVDGASFGYNPAVTAIVDRFIVNLGEQCLPRELDVKPGTNEVPCVVVETRPRSEQNPTALDCPAAPNLGRRALESTVERVVLDELISQGACYQEGTPLNQRGGVPCSEYSMCEIAQLSGPDATACLGGAKTGPNAGYCYVDPKKGLGDPSLVATCPSTERRRLRFVSNDDPEAISTPRNDTNLFIACIGASQTSK
jgi:hypothetical protein